MNASLHDVVVVGGGPCGSAVARLLASWGHRVLLLAREIDRGRGVAEVIPPSARQLLATIDGLDEVERAAFPPNRGNMIWWAGQVRVERSAAGASDGFLIFRAILDDVLLRHAAAGGAEVRLGAVVRSVEFPRDGGVLVHFDARGRRKTVRAGFAVDCSGRAGIIARQGLRSYEPNHRMQALLGMWRADTDWPADADRTVVETQADGWACSLATSPTVRQVAVMVDGAATDSTRGPTLADTYLAELGKTTHIRQVTEGARLEHAWACDASLYSARRVSGPYFLLAGDAATAVDPFWSFGVKKALSSAWVAAVALHTALADHGRREMAFEYFSRREQEVYAEDLARTREYARQAYACHGHEFWARRADGHGPAASDGVDEGSIRLAHEWLRATPWVKLACGPAVRLVREPIVRGREIVLEEAVALRSTTMRFHRGVDLAALVALSASPRPVQELFEAYCHAEGPVELPQFLAGISLLVAEGVLEPRHATERLRTATVSQSSHFSVVLPTRRDLLYARKALF